MRDRGCRPSGALNAATCSWNRTLASVAQLEFSMLYAYHTPQAVLAVPAALALNHEAEGHHGGCIALLSRQTVPTRVSNQNPKPVMAQRVRCAPRDGICVTDLNALPELKALAQEKLRHHVTGVCSGEQAGEGEGEVEGDIAGGRAARAHVIPAQQRFLIHKIGVFVRDGALRARVTRQANGVVLYCQAAHIALPP
jgi:hypothetical protein